MSIEGSQPHGCLTVKNTISNSSLLGCIYLLLQSTQLSSLLQLPCSLVLHSLVHECQRTYFMVHFKLYPSHRKPSFIHESIHDTRTNSFHCKKRIQDVQLLCLRIKVTVKIKVFSAVYSVPSIDHFVYPILTVLLHLLPLSLSINKDAQHVRRSPLHKTKNMDDSPLNQHELMKVPTKVLCRH